MSKRRLAQWWCLLNGKTIPKELMPGPTDRLKRDAWMKGALKVVDALAEKEGMALWKRRYESAKNPVTGDKWKDWKPQPA